MNKFLLLLSFIFISSCASNKSALVTRDYSKGIVYILPSPVQSLVSKHCSEKNIAELDSVFFILESIENSKYVLYQHQFKNDVYISNWVRNTNRYISVFGKLYPLLFKSDEDFANTEVAEEFIKNEKNKIYNRNKAFITRDAIYSIKFSYDGNILYEGYGNK